MRPGIVRCFETETEPDSLATHGNSLLANYGMEIKHET